MKVCGRCKEELPLTSFGPKGDGYQSYCRPCAKEHRAVYYQNNKDKHHAQIKRARLRVREYIKELKESTPCADCGVSYPACVMDFDHQGEKLFNVAAWERLGKSIGRVREEIAKCEIVCANCHRLRTHT